MPTTFLTQPPNLPAEILAERYDSFLATPNAETSKSRKRSGSFYTPAALVNLILDDVLEPFLGELEARCGSESISKISILDPSCGTGQFLVEVARRLLQRMPIGHRLTPTISGIDTDPIAVEICRRRLNELTNSDSFAPVVDIQCSDALLSNPYEPESFDFIVGNPPFGLSRGDKISKIDLPLLRERFGALATGKVNKFILFLGLGCELMKPEGMVALVTPNSWLGIRDATPVRKLMNTTVRLDRVHSIPGSRFFQAGVEVVVPVIRKSPPQTTLQVIAHSKNSGVRKSVVTWGAAPNYLLALELDPVTRGIFDTIVESARMLGGADSLFNPSIATQIYSVGRGTPPQTAEDLALQVFHRSDASNEDDLPYLDGALVGRYSLTTTQRYVRYGPWVAEHQPRERFIGPRVLVREVLAPFPHRIKAAFIEDPAIYNKSVLHILSKGASRDEMRALTCVLNSRIASLYFHLYGRKASRKLFPKLLSDDLARFPLPSSFKSRVACLAAMAEQLERNPLDFELNRSAEDAVAAAYGLTAEQRANVEAKIAILSKTPVTSSQPDVGLRVAGLG